jgi:N-acetylneuraminic acid mutarotase
MSRGVAVPVPGGAVLAGGLLPGDVSTARSYRIALPSGRRHRLSSLPVAAHDAAGALLAGRPAVLGGGGAGELAVVQTLAPDGSWRLAGRLPSPRSDLAAVSSPAGVVVIGGYDGARSPHAVLRAGGGSRFRRVGDLPEGVRYAAVAVLGGSAWIVGGEQNGQELRSVLALDLRSGRVRRAGRLPHALGHAAAVAVGDRILVMGGRTSSGRPTDAMWWFQPASGSWRRAGRLPYPVADAATVATGGAAYLMGGETPDFTDRVVKVAWR